MLATTHNTQGHRLLMPQQPHRNTLKTTQNCFVSYSNNPCNHQYIVAAGYAMVSVAFYSRKSGNLDYIYVN